MTNDDLIHDLVGKDKQTVITECSKLLTTNKRLVKNINKVHEANAFYIDKADKAVKEQKRIEGLSVWQFFLFKIRKK